MPGKTWRHCQSSQPKPFRNIHHSLTGKPGQPWDMVMASTEHWVLGRKLKRITAFLQITCIPCKYSLRGFSPQTVKVPFLCTHTNIKMIKYSILIASNTKAGIHFPAIHEIGYRAYIAFWLWKLLKKSLLNKSFFKKQTNKKVWGKWAWWLVSKRDASSLTDYTWGWLEEPWAVG